MSDREVESAGEYRLLAIQKKDISRLAQTWAVFIYMENLKSGHGNQVADENKCKKYPTIRKLEPFYHEHSKLLGQWGKSWFISSPFHLLIRSHCTQYHRHLYPLSPTPRSQIVSTIPAGQYVQLLPSFFTITTHNFTLPCEHEYYDLTFWSLASQHHNRRTPTLTSPMMISHTTLTSIMKMWTKAAITSE